MYHLVPIYVQKWYWSSIVSSHTFDVVNPPTLGDLPTYSRRRTSFNWDGWWYGICSASSNTTEPNELTAGELCASLGNISVIEFPADCRDKEVSGWRKSRRILKIFSEAEARLPMDFTAEPQNIKADFNLKISWRELLRFSAGWSSNAGSNLRSRDAMVVWLVLWRWLSKRSNLQVAASKWDSGEFERQMQSWTWIERLNR